MNEAILVTGVGVVSPVGHDAVVAYGSVRAGLARIGQSQDIRARDARGKRTPLTCSAVTGITDGHRRCLRLYRMAVRALAQAAGDAALGLQRLGRCDVHVALAETGRPGLDDRAERELPSRIEQRLGWRARRWHFHAQGHAGAYKALEVARATLLEGRADCVLVGGVDTYLDEMSVEWLKDMGRLKSEENPKGFVPGEAAAFIVLETGAAAARRATVPLARVRAVANGIEDASVYEKKPCVGEGLAQAIQTVLAGHAAAPALAVCDLNGERYRANEWGFAMARCFSAERPAPPLWHPADVAGDCGAAAGAFSLVLSSLAAARGEAAPVLAWGSSDDGERGAALLDGDDARPAKERRWA